MRKLFLFILACSVSLFGQTITNGTGQGGFSILIPSAASSPAQLNFGVITVGQTSSAQTATLTNQGALTLTLSSNTISPPNPDFSFTTTCGATLAPGANCTFSITYSPSSAAADAASLVIVNNAGTQSVALAGVGQSVGGLLFAQEPIAWANPHAADGCFNNPDGATHVTKTVCSSGNCNYLTMQACSDAAAANVNTAGLDQDWKCVVTHGNIETGPSGLGTLQLASKTLSGGAKPTRYTCFDSDTPLVRGAIPPVPCVNGVRDNLSGATDIHTRNFNCANPTTVNSINTNSCMIGGVVHPDKDCMWKIAYTGAGGVGIADWNSLGPLGSNHYAFRNGEIYPCSTCNKPNPNAPISLGANNNDPAATIADGIIFDQMYLHGITDDLPSATITEHLVNALRFNCTNCSLVNSNTDQIIQGGQETHQVAITEAPGPQKIVHNSFEGSSSCVFIGGINTIPVATNGASGNNEEIRRNLCTYPAQWMGQTPVAGQGGGYVRKNAFEIKTCTYCLVVGNTFENVDNTGAQGGPAVLIQVRACSGNSCENPVAITQHVIFGQNMMRNTCKGYQTDGQTGALSAGVGVGHGVRNIYYGYNLNYNNGATVAGCGTTGPNYPIFQTASSGAEWGQNAPTCNSTSCQIGPTPIVISRTNGVAKIDMTSAANTSGRKETNVAPGDLLALFGCTNTSFNTTSKGGPEGVPALDATKFGFVNGGLNLFFAQPGLPDVAPVTDTGCIFDNSQGWSNGVANVHNTYIAPALSTALNPSSSQLKSQVVFYGMNYVFQDDIFGGGGGWTDSAYGEGTVTEVLWDTTTLTANYLLFPSRTLSKYTEYGGANNGASPPVTFYAPTNFNCTGTDPTANCLGMVGEMSTGTWNINLADWHGYRLCHSTDAACGNTASPFAAGGAHPAHDGGDFGADFSNGANGFDSAQTVTTYTCHDTAHCQSGGDHHGPYPD